MIEEVIAENQEEQVDPISWETYIKIMKNGPYRSYEKEHRGNPKDKKSEFPIRLERAIKELNYLFTKIQKLPYEKACKRFFQEQVKKQDYMDEKQSKTIDNWLMFFMRDIPQLLWEYHSHKDDLFLVEITLFQLLSDHAYILDKEQNQEAFFQMLSLMTLRDSSMELILNNFELLDLIKRYLEFYFFNSKEWHPITEIILTLLCQMATYYEFVAKNLQNMELVELVIRVYKKMEELDKKDRVRELILKVDDPDPDLEEYDDLGIKWLAEQRKALKIQPNKKDLREPEPEQLIPDQIVPDDPQKMIKMTMATFPSNICETAFEEKYMMQNEAIKSENVFFMVLSLKIVQSLCVDQRYREVRLIQDEKIKILDHLQKLSRLHETFVISRESIRAINNLLYSFDEIILWLKFDTKNVQNDNSNYLKVRYPGRVEIKPFGDPKKLPLNAGLYLDGCGVDFRVGDGLEIIGKTHDYTPQRNLRTGIQLPDQITVIFWFVYFSQQTQKNRNLKRTGQIHTLITCDDGVTPLIFADPMFMMFGVTSIADGKKENGPVKLQSPGMKFFEINMELTRKIFQGWNHVTITLDNVRCESVLYLNGIQVNTLRGVKFNNSVRYIGNSKDGQEPFGYVCDLRVYPRILLQKEIKYLCTYDKNIKLICNIEDKTKNKDVLSEIINMSILKDLKKIIGESFLTNPETCAIALECVSLMCFASTRMRLETAKIGIFEQASSLVQAHDVVVSKYARQLLVSVW